MYVGLLLLVMSARSSLAQPLSFPPSLLPSFLTRWSTRHSSEKQHSRQVRRRLISWLHLPGPVSDPDLRSDGRNVCVCAGRLVVPEPHSTANMPISLLCPIFCSQHSASWLTASGMTTVQPPPHRSSSSWRLFNSGLIPPNPTPPSPRDQRSITWKSSHIRRADRSNWSMRNSRHGTLSGKVGQDGTAQSHSTLVSPRPFPPALCSAQPAWLGSARERWRAWSRDLFYMFAPLKIDY